MEIQEIWKILIRRKWYFIIIPVITAMIAFVFRFLSERTYISESQITTGLTIAKDFVGDNRALNSFEVAISFSNIRENIVSKMVTNRIGYKLLYHDLTVDNPFREPSSDESGVEVPEGERLRLVIEYLENSISKFELIDKRSEIGNYIYKLLDTYRYDEVSLIYKSNISRVGSTDFINIRFEAENPELSAYVVNLWADTFIEFYNNQKRGYLNNSLEVLTQILSEKQKILNQSTKKLNDYKSRYLYRTVDGQNDPISEYERLVRDKESIISGLNFRLQNVRDQIASTDESVNSNIRARIIDTKNEIDRLSTRLISESENQSLSDSIEFLRQELQSQMYLHASTVSEKNNLENLFEQENDLEVQYQIEIADLQNLKNQLRLQRSTAQSLAASQSVLDNLESELVQAREEFIIAQDNYNEARIELLAGSGSVNLSYYGDIPEDAQSRKTLFFTAAGMMGGFMMTLFVVIGLEIIDTRIKNRYRFKRITQLSPSGIIPSLNSKIDFFRSESNHSTDNPHINSLIQIVKKMRYQINSKEKCQIILFTSLRPKAGKSFIITTFIHSFNLIDKKVLVVDTNFRNPDLTKILFGQNGSSKQSSSLVGRESSKLQGSLIDKTQYQNIDILRGKTLNKTPEEVMSRVSFDELLKQFVNTYDYIFLEGAALNTYSDSRELTKYADEIVCVYNASDEFSEVDKESLQFIKDSEKLFLNVLNKVKLEDV